VLHKTATTRVMVPARAPRATKTLTVTFEEQAGTELQQPGIANRSDEGHDLGVIRLLTCGEIGIAQQQGARFLL
jgi:hypothetical protein